MHAMNGLSQQDIMATYLMGKTASQQAQLSMMRTAFDRFDSNRSGSITAKEVQKRFRELGRASSDAVVLQW
jgi:Ca2+-binding EF-hand superfamily protein